MSLYKLLQWPESQVYMEESWFQDEAILDNSENATSSSYFIPFNRFIEGTIDEFKNTLIVSEVRELSKLIVGELDEQSLVSEKPWLGIDMTDEEHLMCIRDN